MMLYNLYLQPKWRKKTDTSEEISHIRWYTDVFGVVSWFSSFSTRPWFLICYPQAGKSQRRCEELRFPPAPQSKPGKPGKLTDVNEKTKYSQGHIHSKPSFLFSCIWLETAPEPRGAPPSVPSAVLAVRHLLEKMQSAIISEQTIPLRLLLRMDSFPEP